MQHEFLLEIGTEEIPAGYIRPALESIKEITGRKLAELSLSFADIKTAATPRRLVVCVSGLDERQADRQEEILGPPRKAAFDKDDKPTKAAIGFAKSRGATVADLQITTTPKGEYLLLCLEKKGQETAKLLAEFIPELIKSIPFPKSMHWGDNRTTFARPIQWLLAVFAGKVVECQLDKVKSENLTRGHRFLAPEPFPVADFAGYVAGLAGADVIVDLEERRKLVAAEINRAATDVGGRIIPDDELLDTVTNLVELPVGVCGGFARKFLQLPREVLITSMRVHQKSFPVAADNGELMANFVAVNNTRVKNPDLTRQGHERVLRARLEDALFFFKEDCRQPLADRLEKLNGVVFQAKLGTMLEKTERLVELAAFLAEQTAPELSNVVRRTARLAKADLVTDMVNEFPSLQGTMGRHYALNDGEEEAVALGIMEHYLPIRAGAPLPTETVGALASMADRLDTIVGCFGIEQIPTGTTDPFGLRRLALGLLHIIIDKGFTLSLSACLQKAMELYGDKLTSRSTLNNSREFIKNRFVNDQVSQGIPLGAIEAVTSVDFTDVVDCCQRIKALVAISEQPAFPLLAGSFKRVNNIIKNHNRTTVVSELLSDSGEQNLFTVLTEVEKEVQPLVADKQYERALQAILRMKEPVDTFFDDVMVMVEDEKIRENRLSLLAGIAELFLSVGDFSKMNQ